MVFFARHVIVSRVWGEMRSIVLGALGKCQRLCADGFENMEAVPAAALFLAVFEVWIAALYAWHTGSYHFSISIRRGAL